MLDKPNTCPAPVSAQTRGRPRRSCGRSAAQWSPPTILGATRERIGASKPSPLPTAAQVIGGAEHESRIELGAIAEIIVDRTSVMKDKAYPRLDLIRTDGTPICGIVGFDGLEPFDAAVALLGTGEAVDAKPEKPASERTDAAPTDPGLVALEAAREAATPVIIGFRRPNFWQAFRGVVETVKPAMGFINVMRPDFHLHLKSGAVAEWHTVDGKSARWTPTGRSWGCISGR